MAGDPGLVKWLIMLGYMDLRRARVCRRSNVGLVIEYRHISWSHHKQEFTLILLWTYTDCSKHTAFPGELTCFAN